MNKSALHESEANTSLIYTNSKCKITNTHNDADFNNRTMEDECSNATSESIMQLESLLTDTSTCSDLFSHFCKSSLNFSEHSYESYSIHNNYMGFRINEDASSKQLTKKLNILKHASFPECFSCHALSDLPKS